METESIIRCVRRLLLLTCAGVAVFVALFILKSVLGGQLQHITSLATLFGVAFASFVSLYGLSSWVEERRRQAWEYRRAVSQQLLVMLMKKFTSGDQNVDEAEVRAHVALWGSPELVKAIGAWNTTYDKLTEGKNVDNNNKIALSAEESIAFQARTADLALVARQDLGNLNRPFWGKEKHKVVWSEDIQRALFNNRKSEDAS